MCHRRIRAEHNLGLLIPFQIRGVGRQVQQLAAPLFDEFSDTISLVGAEVIHNHDLSPPQARGEHLFEVSLEHFAVSGTLHCKSWPHTLHAHAGEQGGVLPSVAGHRAVRSLSFV